MADMEVDEVPTATTTAVVPKGKARDDKDAKKRFEVKKVRYLRLVSIQWTHGMVYLG